MMNKRMVTARGRRKVVCGFKPCEAVGHNWATRGGGGGGQLYYARLHFLRSRQRWSLRKRPAAAGGILVDLSTFVPTTTIVVPTWAQNWKGGFLPLNCLEISVVFSQFREAWDFSFPQTAPMERTKEPSTNEFFYYFSNEYCLKRIPLPLWDTSLYII